MEATGHLEGIDLFDASCDEMRKNENGVDINRNFEYLWEMGDDDQGSDSYHGARALSEPQAATIAEALARFKPSLMVDVHSGDVTMMRPLAANKTASQEPLCGHQQALSDYVKAQTTGFCTADDQGLCPKTGMAWAALSPPYLAYGTLLDHAALVAKVPYVYTFEVFTQREATTAAKHAVSAAALAPHAGALQPEVDATGTDAFDAVVPRAVIGEQHRHRGLLPAHTLVLAEQRDCFAYFNPSSSAQLEHTKHTWSDALLHSPEFLLQNRKLLLANE